MAAQFDLAAFGPGATRSWVDVAGARVHVVSAGSGDTVVLIAGWPQSLWVWRHVLPKLAQRFRAHAIDLPGMGDSALPSPAYDVNGVAQILRATLERLGVTSFYLVGHDIGAWVSYPFAAQYAVSVRKLVLMYAVIPGIVATPAITPQTVRIGWHFAFNSIAELPEALTAGRERVFLSWFFKHRALITDAFTSADLDEYERIYSAPGAMTSGVDYYRNMVRSAEQNLAHASAKLLMPVLVICGDAGVGARMIDVVKNVYDDAHGVVFEKCGHYIPEAQQHLLRELEAFLV